MISYIKAAHWPNGNLSQCMINIDDLYPDDTPQYDHGGNMKKDGVIERIFIGDIQKNYPRVKFFFFVIPNAREKWIDEVTVRLMPRNTYLLSKHRDWVEWINDKVKKNKFYLGLHGWEHVGIEADHSKPGVEVSHAITTEFLERDVNDTMGRLINMQNEFYKVGLIHEKVWRPPAGASNDTIMNFLADNDIIDAQFYTHILGHQYPHYKISPNGKPILVINNTAEPDNTGKGIDFARIDKSIISHGACLLYLHFSNNTLIRGFPRGVRNGLTPLNISEIKKVLGYIERKYGKQIEFSSYEELAVQFKRQQALHYRQSLLGNGTIVIDTENISSELEGATWEIVGPYSRVIITNRDNESLAKIIFKSEFGTFVVCYPSLTYDIESDGFVKLLKNSLKEQILYAKGAKRISLTGEKIRKRIVIENNVKKSDFIADKKEIIIKSDGREHSYAISWNG